MITPDFSNRLADANTGYELRAIGPQKSMTIDEDHRMMRQHDQPQNPKKVPKGLISQVQWKGWSRSSVLEANRSKLLR
jgi:hypothetical protein